MTSSRRLGLWWLVAPLLLTGCTFSWSPRVKPVPAATCPDFSGDYEYPGLQRVAEICPHLDTWPEVSFPGGGGFHILADAPQTLHFRQERCEWLRIRAGFGPVSLGAPPEGYPLEIVIPLMRQRRADRVEWGPDSLFWRRRFEPVGYVIGISINHMEMRLTRVPEGLRYQLKQTEHSGFSEHLEGELDCTLRRVDTAHPAQP